MELQIKEITMSDSKKIKYLSKTVSFSGKSFTLFSIDGQTWSSRKQELLEIKERQERDKVSFAAVKEENGNTKVVAKAKVKPTYVAKHEDEEEIAVEISAEEEFPQVDYSLDSEKQPKGRGRKPATLPVKPKEIKHVITRKQKNLPVVKKSVTAKSKKKAVKVAPKKRASGKPKAKLNKVKNKKKAA